MRTLIVLALASTLLTACGVKGSLYLPEQRYPQPKEPSDTSQASPSQLQQEAP